MPLATAWQRHVDLRRLAIISVPTIPSLIALALPERITSLLRPFSPRAVIYSDAPSTILLAPISITHGLPLVSRILQSVLLGVLAVDGSTLLALWAFCSVLALARTGTGYLFSRSVGWAYPALFSHEALYEEFGGVGPGLIGLLAVRSAYGSRVDKRIWGERRVWVLAGVTMVLCGLEGAPWTYLQALLGTIGALLLLGLRRRYTPLGDTEKPEPPALDPMDDSDEKVPSQVLSISLAVLAASAPLLTRYVLPPKPSDIAIRPQDRPLLGILVLTYPRPDTHNTQPSSPILNSTISSFLPFLSDRITLGIFTHAPKHPEFDELATNTQDGWVTYYRDADLATDAHVLSHEAEGHYLHLAEALRWAYEEQRGEWIMQVEDDFPLCRGPRGWGQVEEVLARLERSRIEDQEIRAGWVATGGNGLIMHHSTLPLLSYLLRTYALPIPLPSMERLYPDQVIQQCLLGLHTACARTSPGPGMVITSRQVLDHIGGMATTTKGKALNSDKWRCGWRHAYHGWDEVEVVVV